jgi:threonylcarbamoyladenosine tRNA methylthiotransferase MtaB
VVKKAMKLNNKSFVAAVGCYAQLPEELAVDCVDLILWSYRNLNYRLYQ